MRALSQRHYSTGNADASVHRDALSRVVERSGEPVGLGLVSVLVRELVRKIRINESRRLLAPAASHLERGNKERDIVRDDPLLVVLRSLKLRGHLCRIARALGGLGDLRRHLPDRGRGDVNKVR